jgi:branched-chain amino acid transport system substrate-binding protein
MKPELINLSSTAPATAVLIIRQARELGYKGRFVKTAGGGPKEILEAIDAKDVEGMITILFVDLANPGYRRLADAYKKSVGQDPDEIIVPYYDGARVLLQAIQKAGDIYDTSKVAAAFAKALPMESTQGDTMTLGNQQILTTIYVANVKNGKAVVIGKAQ